MECPGSKKGQQEGPEGHQESISQFQLLPSHIQLLPSHLQIFPSHRAMILQMVNIRSRLQLFLPVGITSTSTGWWSPVTMLMSSVAMSLCRKIQWSLLNTPPPGKQRYSGWTQTISTSSAWSGNNWRGDLMFTILLPFCRMLPVSLDNRADVCQYYFHWPVCCDIPCPREI